MCENEWKKIGVRKMVLRSYRRNFEMQQKWKSTWMSGWVMDRQADQEGLGGGPNPNSREWSLSNGNCQSEVRWRNRYCIISALHSFPIRVTKINNFSFPSLKNSYRTPYNTEFKIYFSSSVSTKLGHYVYFGNFSLLANRSIICMEASH